MFKENVPDQGSWLDCTVLTATVELALRIIEILSTKLSSNKKQNNVVKTNLKQKKTDF